MPTYVLPDLDYDFGALEPHISGEIMELHHGKHHKAYVKKANETLEKLDEARDKEDFSRIGGAGEGARLQPVRSRPALDLLEEPHARGWRRTGRRARRVSFARDFGGFEPFKAQLTEVASTIMGSGWAALVWEPLAAAADDRPDLRSPVEPQPGRRGAHGHRRLGARLLPAVPQPEGGLLRAVWNLWNWEDVNARLEAARRLDLQVPESVGPAGGRARTL